MVFRSALNHDNDTKKVVVLFGALFWTTISSAADFARDIQPILAAHCYACHGPDEARRQANLRLDDLSSAQAELSSGKQAIVPGKPNESELVRRILATDPDQRMPPPDSGSTLTEREQETLQQWIASGADWKPHWAFVRPKRSTLPTIQNPAWARNPIDHFVAAHHDSLGLSPAKEADRETLLRRVALTLTGLPPTPSEVDAFLADSQSDAYDRVVDRLLHSPRYGEHFARPWLDAARYGDTHGLHLDNVRSMWPYRDWLIHAWNDNMPFDQFTIEQMAGDLLPNATIDQRVATGFHRCNVTTNEEGSIDAEFQVRYAMDRVETTAATWMGLTLNCAACHDHKYDPISQREYYQLFAFFDSVTDRARDGDLLIPPPSVRVADRVQRQKHRQLVASLAEIDTQLSAMRTAAESKLENWSADYIRHSLVAQSPQDSRLTATFDASEPNPSAPLTADTGQSAVVRGEWRFDAGRRHRAVRFDGHTQLSFIVPSEPVSAKSNAAWSLAMSVYSDAIDAMDLWTVERQGPEAASRWSGSLDNDDHLHVTSMTADGKLRWSLRTDETLTRRKWQTLIVTHDGSDRPTGIGIFLDGERLLASERDAPNAKSSTGLTNANDRDWTLTFGGGPQESPWTGRLDDVRFFDRILSADEATSLSTWDPIYELLIQPTALRTPSQQATVCDAYLSREAPEFQQLQTQRRAVDQERLRLESQYASALVLQQRSQPAEVHLRIRGQYDQLGEVVHPGVPTFLPPLPKDSNRDRLALARWLTDRSHPLTARVLVNRLWQQHFGVGLVATPEDFGMRGERPSHPELLDWLAVELMESGWDVKHIQRLIVTSSTFRQSTHASTDAYRRDPENRQLARGPRFRLDAEVIRDISLSSSGLLIEQLGGPSGKVYQPAGLWEAIGYTNSNTAHFQQDHGTALFRRSLYTFWKRTSPPPTMQILNAPSREVCTLRRQRSNTPTAALALLNDVQFVEAARRFAQRLLLATFDKKSSVDQATDQAAVDRQRLTLAWRLATGRRPTPREIANLQELLLAMRTDFRSDSEGALQLIQQGESPRDETLDVVELASWTIVCNTLLNLDEVIHQW